MSKQKQLKGQRELPGIKATDFESLGVGTLLVPKGLTDQKRVSAKRIDVGSHYEIRCSVIPVTGSGAKEQFDDCLKQVNDLLESQGLEHASVAQQTVFVPSDGYGSKRAGFQQQLDEFYGKESVPPTSFVGQTPADKQAAMEVILLAPKDGHNLKIRHEAIGAARYKVAEADGLKWVYSAGLEGTAASDDTSDKAREAFGLMKAILTKEGLSFNDVVLQKNYIDTIVGSNYNKFNMMRADVYASEGLVEDFPAATGIGMDTGITGGVCLEFVALGATKEDVLRESVENPRQRSSYKYDAAWLKVQAASKQDGRGRSVGQMKGGQGAGLSVSTPKFSRGKYLRVGDKEYFLVSGTAAFVGTGTLFTEELKEPAWIEIDDLADSVGMERIRESGIGAVAFPDGKLRVKAETAVEAQTWETIKNISSLIGQTGMTLDDMAQVRVYVKDLDDASSVLDICDKIFKDTPSLCVNGPVCYDEMLVEIEGVATKDVR